MKIIVKILQCSSQSMFNTGDSCRAIHNSCSNWRITAASYRGNYNACWKIYLLTWIWKTIETDMLHTPFSCKYYAEEKTGVLRVIFPVIDGSTLMIKIFQTQRIQFLPLSKVSNVKIFLWSWWPWKQGQGQLMACNKTSCHDASWE